MFLSRTAPTELPFSLEELKRHCRVDDSYTDDDDLLRMYAWGAVRHGEFLTNRVWGECTWKGTINAFPHGDISIPKSPCSAVTSISYTDSSGTIQILDPTLYKFYPSSFERDGGRPFAFVSPIGTWPEGSDIQISFTAGWPILTLPQEFVQWCFVKISAKYEQREDLASATRKIAIGFPRDFSDGLLDSYYLPKS